MTFEEKVGNINKFIKDHAWFDFSVMSYENGELELHGGIDLTVSRLIKINFIGVLGYYGPFDWKTDTQKTSIDIPQGDEMISLNHEHDIEVGYNLFRFRPEYHSKPVLVASEDIVYEVREVRYG